mmetsp:Transcript_14073/g.16029  ORF Transcript_14073/g.16029 Transcript_14073/m.16029 type:complete len:122 (-) Transcript_14073:184-549(-)
MALHPWQFAFGVMVAIAGALLLTNLEPKVRVDESQRSKKERNSNVTSEGEYEMYHRGKPRESKCSVCFEKYDKSRHHPIAFIPCKHTCCANCSAGIQVCHLCRRHIESRTLLFDAVSPKYK